jgi:putative transposase
VHTQEFGVQPICDALKGTDAEIAPSTYYAANTRAEAARPCMVPKPAHGL